MDINGAYNGGTNTMLTFSMTSDPLQKYDYRVLIYTSLSYFSFVPLWAKGIVICKKNRFLISTLLSYFNSSRKEIDNFPFRASSTDSATWRARDGNSVFADISLGLIPTVITCHIRPRMEINRSYNGGTNKMLTFRWPVTLCNLTITEFWSTLSSSKI